MKTSFLIIVFLTFTAFAQDSKENQKKDMYQKDKMDYGDKQLLRRDICRKPIEALETKYENIKKEDLAKMKDECGY